MSVDTIKKEVNGGHLNNNNNNEVNFERFKYLGSRLPLKASRKESITLQKVRKRSLYESIVTTSLPSTLIKSCSELVLYEKLVLDYPTSAFKGSMKVCYVLPVENLCNCFQL